MSATDPGESVRKRAAPECRAIIGALSATQDPHAGIHAARKAIRRLRVGNLVRAMPVTDGKARVLAQLREAQGTGG